ncbi:flavodoxin [Autumnicola musiva]|uniref:Flavodoxin n=1 Tax=Autumnicola musiva TaxID=3075589 RepID=A0ABU3DAX6_9FLAO|nr:flavodoxin [Zunongwangia sp. F117]MDT0678689.1 flavodoxin [Zunongwangia sp. F117]
MKPLLLLFTLMFSIGCKTQTDNSKEVMDKIPSGKILTVYLSRTSNTKVIAEMVQQRLGGKLIEIEKKNPYPIDYQEIVTKVARENEEGYLPPLNTYIKNIKDYDTVFIGFPTWDMQLPPPMKTFLAENDMSGKTLLPFNTNAGYGLGSSLSQIKNLCPDSNILKEFSVEGGYEKRGVLLAIEGERKKEVSDQIDAWLEKVGILK